MLAQKRTARVVFREVLGGRWANVAARRCEFGVVKAFEELPGPLLVMLDDHYTINNPAIHDSLTFLLDHAPSGVTFLLATRGGESGAQRLARAFMEGAATGQYGQVKPSNCTTVKALAERVVVSVAG